jgi:hypothetical protein
MSTACVSRKESPYHGLTKGTYYKIAYSALACSRHSRETRKENLAQLAGSFSNGSIPKLGLNKWEW